MIRILRYILFFFAPLCTINAQEVILSLSENSVARQYYNEHSTFSKKNLNADTLELPFIDDFSNSEVQPNPNNWVDNFAFINNRYSSNPITAGMATLDSYNYNGSPYAHASSKSSIADYLTSQAINLDYNTNDNIFLSFYFQAKGLGNQPDESDSLCLEFYNLDLSQWDRIWSIPGGTIMENFEMAMIPIDDPAYLKKAFQFRFLNYASLPEATNFESRFGNWDHWHIDYVILDKDRSITDTIIRDVAYVKEVSSMLKDYESIPWRHLQAAFIEQTSPYINTSIVNLDENDRNVSKYIEIKNLLSGHTYNSTPTASDIKSDTLIDFSFEYDYLFDFNQGDTALFQIRTILQTDAFDYKANDTLSRLQVFNKYYAYDDGSAEHGYGLDGTGTSNASVAVHYEAFTADSLRAIDMYFNQVVDSLNLNYYFYLSVWADLNGEPGELIYEQMGERPAYSNELNKFTRYELETPVLVVGDFYIGWTKTVDKFSHTGLDINRDNSHNNFYNEGNGWINSQIPGSIMIRPVLSISPLSTNKENISAKNPTDLQVYPNPADQYFHISINNDDYSALNIDIYDLTGRMIYTTEQYSGSIIHTSALAEGVYILSVRNQKSQDSYSQKIIIRH